MFVRAIPTNLGLRAESRIPSGPSLFERSACKPLVADLACHGPRYDPDMPDPDWFKRDPSVGVPRQRVPGEEVWRLRSPDGPRVQSYELRDDSKAGGGWDVTMLQDDELLFSRRCVDERGARHVARAFRQDTGRAGWVE